MQGDPRDDGHWESLNADGVTAAYTGPWRPRQEPLIKIRTALPLPHLRTPTTPESSEPTPEPATTSTSPTSRTAPTSGPRAAEPAEPQRQQENPPARQHDQQHQRDDDPADRDRERPDAVAGRRFGNSRQADAELLRERLRDQVDATGESRAVLFARQIGRHRVADPAHARVREKPFGATPRRDGDIPCAWTVVLLGHDEHYYAEVLSRIAGFALRADTPLAPDLEGHVRGGPVADIGECHHGDLAPRLLAQLGDHGGHVGDGGWVEHGGEVVDVAAGGRDGDLQ